MTKIALIDQRTMKKLGKNAVGLSRPIEIRFLGALAFLLTREISRLMRIIWQRARDFTFFVAKMSQMDVYTTISHHRAV